MIASSAYLLVFHGSRDRQAQYEASNLGRLLTIKYKSKTILTQQNYLESNFNSPELKIAKTIDNSANLLVEVAALELGTLSLSESLINFARVAAKQGCDRIKVLPLFLAPGVHVRQDIPAEIALAIKKINNQLTIELSPYLGKYSGIANLLAHKFAELSAEIRILVAHGSRLPKVAQYYQNLAKPLNAQLAYWSTMPSLEQQITAQIAAGQKKIAILPYFLFSGRITTAIATEVARLQAEHQNVELILGEPLGTTEALAQLIVEEI